MRYWNFSAKGKRYKCEKCRVKRNQLKNTCVRCKVNLSQHKVNEYESKKRRRKKPMYTTNKSLLTGFKRFCNYISL